PRPQRLTLFPYTTLFRSSGSSAPDDCLPPLGKADTAVSRHGDVWQVGRHRLLCGDSQKADTLKLLMNGERADLIFTDPPYNVPIDRKSTRLNSSHVSISY